MAGNIKLEIVYYATEPDATLEFGLKGNFAVRLLSNRVQKATELVSALKKASVRNEFILVVGGFEERAVVEVLARAVGREVVLQAEEQYIPADSIPLMAEDGTICGSVMESGFQSIVLLSGEPEKRDRVFKSLLLPYLFERYKEIHSVYPATEAPEQPENKVPEATLEEEPEVQTEPEYVDETENETEAEEILLPDSDEWQAFVTNLPEFEEDGEEDPPAPKKKRRIWRILLIVFLSLALVLGAAFSYIVYFVPWQNNRKIERFSALYAKKDNFASLSALNTQTIGWLKMENAGIDTPVVHAGKADADYYHYHLLDGTLNPIGTPYTPKAIKRFDGLSMVRMDGYFDPLQEYLNEDFAKRNRGLQFHSLSYTAEWRVFSAFTFDKNPVFDYLKSQFADEAEYAKQLLILKNASKIGKRVAVDEKDTVAVFVATRFGRTVVVAAKLIKQEETNETVQAITKPDSVSSASEISSSANSSGNVSSSAPVVEYKAEDNKLKLVDKGGDNTDLPPLSDAEIKDNLDIAQPPVSSVPSKKPVSSAPPSVSTGKTVTVIDDNVNVRTGAGTSYKSLGHADEKKAYAYLGSVKDPSGVTWYKIQFTANTVGYVSAQFSKLNSAGVTSSQTASSSTVTSGGVSNLVITVLSNGVNVREGAGTSYAKLGLVNLGQVFAYVAEKTVSGAVWYSFQYTAEKIGWIRSDFASKSTANNAPSQSNIALGNVLLTVSNNGVTIKGTALDIVASVIEAEMGSDYPLESLKAQAVATYSFLLVRGAAKGTPVVAPMKVPGTRCRQAAKDVLGQCAYYNGQIAQTYYYAISAGFTANCHDIWTAKIPYLVAVESAYDKTEKGFATEVSFTSEELKTKFNKQYPDQLSFEGLEKGKWFACTYDSNNTYCKEFLVANRLTLKGNSLCSLLGLRSGAFTLSYNGQTDLFIFKVRGYGHGVGLSQVGAKGYASGGWDYKKILQHYYPGVNIK